MLPEEVVKELIAKLPKYMRDTVNARAALRGALERAFRLGMQCERKENADLCREVMRLGKQVQAQACLDAIEARRT